jgi:hypothetical protein
MDKVIEMFNGVKNVEFSGHSYSEEFKANLPVFTLKEPPAEEWNRRAEKINTEAFIEKFNRRPKDYEEVLKWVYSHIPDEYVPEQYKNRLAANKTASAY